MRLGSSTAWALSSLLGLFAAGCGDDTGGAGGGGGSDDSSSSASGTTTASSTGSGSTGASGLAPSGPGNPAKPEYAPGPYGVQTGMVLEDFSFVGYTQPHTDKADLETLSMHDFYNPTGDGVFPADGRAWAGLPKPKVLSISVAAYWCAPCKHESQVIIPAIKEAHGAEGAEFLFLLSDGNDGNVPPVLEELDRWIDGYDMTVPAAIDPGPVFQPVWDANAYPENILVRTSDMRIMGKIAGSPELTDSYWDDMRGILASPMP